MAAALLHDVVEDAPTRVPDLTAEFGAEVASLVDGVTKLVGIAEMANLPPDSRDPKVESLRKMLLAMVGDVRVVLIKLADRLHNMRTMDSMLPEKQRRISRETLDIYAPLANALGIYQIKWELEDLSFRYLEPETYTKINRELNQHRDVREAYVEQVTATLQAALEEHGVHEAIVKGRSKHIYSIYRKMRKKGRQHLGGDLRSARHPCSGTRCRRLLRRPGRRAYPVAPHQGGVRRLYRQPQREPVPVTAHGGYRAGRPDSGGADSHARDGSHCRHRHCGALAL